MVAYLMDLLLIYSSIFVIKAIFNINILDELEEILILFLNILYNVIMVSSKNQATLGKMLCKIIITDEYGKRLSIAHSFGRCMAYYYSYITFGIGFLMILFSKKKLALHDRISHTYVTYK